jgi:outer membrane protein assembly factor BamB
MNINPERRIEMDRNVSRALMAGLLGNLGVMVMASLLAAGLSAPSALAAERPSPLAAPADFSAKVYTEQEAWNLGWPMMHGPFGNFLPARTGVKLVDDLKDVRVIWESEDRDFGRAKCSTGLHSSIVKSPTKFCALGASQHGGSWAGPIVAEGKVFGTSFRPGGKEYEVAGGKAALEVDDLLITLDANTGKTLWKAAEPGGLMWGIGKRGTWQVGPACHQGKVFSLGTTGRLFAYEAGTGKKLWQTDIGPTHKMMEGEKAKVLASLAKGVMPRFEGYGWATSLVVAEGVLVAPLFDGLDTSLRGVDVETGKTRWELKAAISRHATPNVWRSGGKEYLLAATVTTPALRLIEPTSGKVLWTVQEGLGPTRFSLAPSATHVLINVGSKATGKRDTNFGLLGAYRITPEKAERAWTFADKEAYRFVNWPDSCSFRRALLRDGLVYASLDGDKAGAADAAADAGADAPPAGRGRLVVAREDTGEVLAEHINAGKEEADQLGGLCYLVEDRLLCRKNASHAPSHGGRHPFTLWSADPKDLRRQAGVLDRHDLATGYMIFMELPIVAGRMWMRDERGFVVCYDLRKEQK